MQLLNSFLLFLAFCYAGADETANLRGNSIDDTDSFSKLLSTSRVLRASSCNSNSCPPEPEYEWYCAGGLFCDTIAEDSAGDLYRKIAREEVNQKNVAKAATILLLPSISKGKDTGGIGNVMGKISRTTNKRTLKCVKDQILKSYCSIDDTNDYADLVKVYIKLMGSANLAGSVQKFLDGSFTVIELAEELASLALDKAISMGYPDAESVVDEATEITNHFVAGKQTMYNVWGCCGGPS